MIDVPKNAPGTHSSAGAETSINQGASDTMDDQAAAVYPMGIKLTLITISLMLA
ncbi:hypothetical protein ACHAQD_012574, partial [Fusarium lateritium]